MSLALPRPPAAAPPLESDRASVVLPTVKCSTCAGSIPLNALGEHVCRAPSRQPMSPAVPPIITRGPPSPAPPHAKLPAATPGLQRPNAPGSLYPASQDRSRTGMVPPRPGDYPDVPHSAASESSMGRWPIGDGQPAGHVLPSPAFPDTTSGGFAGMAGVGRRAFAAAAWSVRAGIGLAHQAGIATRDQSIPMPIAHPSTRAPEMARGSPPRSSPSRGSPPRAPPLPPPQTDDRGSVLIHKTSMGRTPTPRGPVILPKAPLSGRAPTIRAGSRAESRADDRSASRADDRPPSRPEDHHRTASRADSRPPPKLQLDQRSASAMSHRDREQNEPSPFFERYKQTIGSKSDQTHAASSRWDKDDDMLSVSGSLEDASQLPWLRSASPTEESRVDHQRKLTSDSIDSASSSTSYGPGGIRNAAGFEEVVMTPNQSWEGLSERTGNLSIDSKAFNTTATFSLHESSHSLAEIGEEDEDEDEGEHFVMGAPFAGKRGSKRQSGANHNRSNSESTVTLSNSPQGILDPPRIALANTPSSPLRSRTMPSSAAADTATRRRQRVCASCGDNVGGSRRFVERDGVILCEADWKKLYLPSCRRCKQSIEKSAVSSSDGQLKGKWHRACFTCTRCDRPFDGDDFYVHDGRPWCQYHYAQENGTLCASGSCGKPIEGPCILAPGSNGSSDQRFHPGHLRCEHRGGASGAQNCREPMDEFYEIGGARLCERHANEVVRRLAGGGSVGSGRALKRRTLLENLSNPLLVSR